MPGGLDALMRRNHELAMLGQRILCERLGLAPVGVESMLGSMAAVHLPNNPAAFDAQGQPRPDEEWRLNNELFARFKIEVPAYYWPGPPKMLLASAPMPTIIRPNTSGWPRRCRTGKGGGGRAKAEGGKSTAEDAEMMKEQGRRGHKGRDAGVAAEKCLSTFR